MTVSDNKRARSSPRRFTPHDPLPAGPDARRIDPAFDAREAPRSGDRYRFGQGNPSDQFPDYADLFEHAPVGYMLLDPAGRIVKINHTGAAILGWDAAWLAGKSFSRWVTNNDKPLLFSHFNSLRGGEDCISQALRVKNRQGRIVHLRLESLCRPTGSRSEAYYRSVMIDLSGDQRSARKLRRLQSQLTHVARLNTAGELASSLAHDLNQPLGTVVLNCEAALRLLSSDAGQGQEFAEALTEATEAASFAGEIVRHLRGFLRNTGGLRAECELSALIREVSKLIEADARDNDIEMVMEIERHLPRVRVDPVQIEQVLLNLAHNSIEAMRDHDRGVNRVVIKARRESPHWLRVSVTDTGPGLNADKLNRLFVPFYTTKSNGMGMGLSISRTIIEAHEGRLWAAPGTGNGAKLHFTLPTLDGARHAD